MILLPSITHRATIHPLLCVALVLALSPFVSVAWAQRSADDGDEGKGAGPSPLQLTKLQISPQSPGPETLCTLTVEIANRSERPVFSLAFEVELDGRELPVYERQVYMVNAPPTGEDDSFELRLFNFWTSDSRHPAPADGELEVVVRLVEAQWLEVSTEEDGTEVWTPKGPVAGLPSEARRTLELAGSSDR